MTFAKHLRQTIGAVFLASLALGCVVAVLLLLAERIQGDISLALTRGDGTPLPWTLQR